MPGFQLADVDAWPTALPFVEDNYAPHFRDSRFGAVPTRPEHLVLVLLVE